MVAEKYLYIKTFGCQMNVHDSEQIVALLKASGYESTDDFRKADLIIVNTCSIREKAAQKVYSQLGKFRELKRSKPGLIIGMGGCLAQQWRSKIFGRAPFLDLVFGTHNIHQLPDLIRTIETTGSRLEETTFHESVKSVGIVALPQNGAVSAYVTIMQGCNNFCSFCVVPYLRGPEVSRPSQDVIDEVKALADRGIREVTLLGQNVNSYGKTVGTDFAALLHEVGKIGGIERIRYTTSHPKDLSFDLMRCYADIDKLCEHIHLPVQSGSDLILKRMNRGYTKAQYLEKVESLRNICPDISITSDMIVGFPGETERDFQETIDLMEKIRFNNLFSFRYSEREGTAAVKFADKVDECIKRERLQALQSLQEKHTLERNRALEGRIEDVLVEGVSKKMPDEMVGRTRSNKIVNFRGKKGLIGKTVSVLITEAYLHSLRGELHQGRG
ncbi:MAG: tRNA (N6-isopentenyl adenosine(37)-C2)-methylthiotransferase MiaB [Syntrophobacterales bacterium CG_4_8_14_3_um_filter_49_14]|nr:MAG: tRNA (N6-isopentenyl adenosine(37)-C2)-methylthiotransferase MiaB [Syntrophobacterales bacterium CG23_combo_of_CG06-09_8_20_14_all_48_27]PJA48868.1 MAG: tRNA (N6-isopentenyl adenosine(37)-C2)-methylthiotransferase MiaB [Syntrophobacterales bacterium CG_4_9_14_3_um_filter_49_8]PJC76333.1 MAG: tRNA (N6-isopentenyl adenosine(37)-C2)-methylthiotransferase MiaB [Syntrophobacterales bacterium CG_4_8_14_3_um_filter_49_14]